MEGLSWVIVAKDSEQGKSIVLVGVKGEQAHSSAQNDSQHWLTQLRYSVRINSKAGHGFRSGG